MLRLSARGPGRPPAPIQAAPSWTLPQLQSAVQAALALPHGSQLTLRVGFPPQPLDDHGDATATLTDLGLVDGEVVVVEQRGASGCRSAAQESAAMEAKKATGAGYHGSEADVARQQRQAAAPKDSSVTSAAMAGFSEGDRVLYRGREQVVTIEGEEVSVDAEQVATIVSISTAGLQSGEEPMIAVRLPSGTVRDTTFDRLSAYRPQGGAGASEVFVPPPSSATS